MSYGQRGETFLEGDQKATLHYKATEPAADKTTLRALPPIPPAPEPSYPQKLTTIRHHPMVVAGLTASVPQDV